MNCLVVMSSAPLPKTDEVAALVLASSHVVDVDCHKPCALVAPQGAPVDAEEPCRLEDGVAAVA